MALLDQISALSRPQKIVLGLLPVVVVGALGWFLLIDPKRQERDGLVLRNEDVRAQVLKAQADEANLRPFRAQAAALRRRLEAARERLPNEREIPRLYRQITDLAFQAGLAVALFQPKPPEDRTAFSEIPISVTTEGSYHQVGAFFDRLGRLPRVVTLGDFRMNGIDRPTGSVRAEMSLSTYVFRPEGAPPPAAKPAGAAPAPAAAPPAAPAPAGGTR